MLRRDILVLLLIPMVVSIEYSILVKDDLGCFLIPIINGSLTLNISRDPVNLSMKEYIGIVDNRSMDNLFERTFRKNGILIVNNTGLGYLVFEIDDCRIIWEEFLNKKLYYIHSGNVEEYNITEIPFEIERNNIKEKIIFGVGLLILLMFLI